MDEMSRESTPETHEVVIKLEVPWSADDVATVQPFPGVPSTAQHQFDTTSGSRLSLNTSHLCQRCSAAFVLFSSLELHMETFHGDKLHTALPVSSTPGNDDGGNYGDKVGSHAVDRGRYESDPDMRGVEKNSPQLGSTLHCQTSSSAGHLKKHRLVHSGDRPFACDVCGKAFTLSSKLKAHKLIHADYKPFVCEVCTKGFTEAGTLKRHKLIHTDYKPFVCDVCNRAFTQAATLKRHTLIHSDCRSFVCDVCSKAFTEAWILKKHTLIHMGHKPFVCAVCSKGFFEAETLKKHQVTHSNHKPFVCDVCNRAFTQSGSLNRHKFIHHGSRQHVCV